MKKFFLFLVLFITTDLLFAQWNSDPSTGGKIINNTISTENYQVSVSDGANGTIVIFESGYNSIASNIYAQRINSDGQLQWGLTNNPKPVCLHAAEKYIENVIPDGSGGVFIAWSDYRNSVDTNDMYIQHLNSNGDPLWPANGIMINNLNDRESFEVRLCSDGGSGVIVVWSESIYDTDNLLTTYSQLFAQKYNSAGAAQWGDGGMEVCTAVGLRGASSVVPDGSGGAIISFLDTRNSNQLPDDDFDNLDIYAQRISSAGSLLWTDDGVAVNTQSYNQFIGGEYLQTNATISDGAGGVIILFDDYTGDNAGNSNFYVQHLNASGVKQWAAAGLPVCISGRDKFLIKTQSDGAGGMVSFWSEDRIVNGMFSTYAQRILGSGSANWVVNGIKLIDIGGNGGFGNDLINDGNGNYIFTWTDDANHLQAQKINGSGVIQWGVTNKEVCTNPNAFPVLTRIVKSDAGNTIITWLDNRNYTNSSTDIYAAKLDANGYLVSPPSATTYITVANGNWNVGATWQGGVMPPVNADVRIRHKVTVTANASCHSIRVEPKNGNITVNTGINLSVLQ
jgi:hypothetical protein